MSAFPTYKSSPLALAKLLSEQPWATISSDGLAESVTASSDVSVLVDRCSAILLSKIVTLAKSRNSRSSGNQSSSGAAIAQAIACPRTQVKLRGQLSNSKSRNKEQEKQADKPVNIVKKKSLTQRVKQLFSRSSHSSIDTKSGVEKIEENNIGEKTNDPAEDMLPANTILEYEMCLESSLFPPMVTAQVRQQIHIYVQRIALSYNSVPYHNFEHATHVLLSANKLLYLLVTASDNATNANAQYAYGLSSNFAYHLAFIFAALVHDVEHGGVSNQQLVIECDPLSILYNDQSILEQHSLAVAFKILLEPDFEELRAVMFPTKDDFVNFRKVVIDLVLTTDVGSGERMQIVKSKWKEAFGVVAVEKDEQMKQKLQQQAAEKSSNCVSSVSDQSSFRESLPSIREALTGENGHKESTEETKPKDFPSLMNKNRRLSRLDSVSPANSFSESESEEDSELDSSLRFSGTDDESSKVEDRIMVYDHETSATFDRTSFAVREMGEKKSLSSKSDFRRHTLDQFSSANVAQINSASESNDNDFRRQSLPVTGRSFRRSASYRLGIKRALTLSGGIIEEYAASLDDTLKATVVLEWMIKAADVGALLQCFQNFMKWSSRLFDEMYLAYRSGRCSNPADGWYENQITFFDSYIAQLAARLKETGVFGECSDLFTIQVQRNRARWIMEGMKLTAELTENAQNRFEERIILHKNSSNRRTV
mmetsp:Transcript_14577/g.22489  ORF Transcript_14577/g.22489 Transcript_14577/m.22489 type:complete len:709 (+) Transcript_14577:328-2454(+)|eukprot:CAMPEP_0196817468 /NCGR_PEP_ID=MMETSP1362-20130617/60931_1 /TAXON_ID=163516 /ORGANISM="Leptocylindrus danicus, Strain CCMP1856" /LENGTH=708 /DNA_ID=CAMNT_0042195169 /DNA_START=256 /DNA_END=2382 /DNA_ORIENTATION=+